MAPSTLVLRDIHQPPAPGWWPPAPGWWALAALLLAAFAFAAWRWRRRRLQRKRLQALFDEAVRAARTPAERVAAVSQLLRRAARRRDPAVAALHGEDWSRYLMRRADAPTLPPRTAELLRDGGYRRTVDADDAAALVEAARRLFLAWGRER